MNRGSYDIVDPASQAIRDRVSALLDIGGIEMILCYGVRRSQSYRWSLFNAEDEKGDQSEIRESVDMDIFMVIHPSEKHREHELVDAVVGLNTEVLRLVPVIHSSTPIADPNSAGKKFFQRVVEAGVLIYQKEGYKIPTLAAKRRTNYGPCQLISAEEFLSGAEFYMAQRRHRLALFMMHQAVENCCCNFIQTLLGYRATSHSLRRLLSLTENITPNISTVFYDGTEKENKLFGLLARAYSEARYSGKFEVSKEQAEGIYEKVKAVLSRANAILLKLTTRNCVVNG